MSHSPIPEHDAEPVKGLPGLLPKGEQILWQGRPRWRQLARHALLTRLVVVWFVICAAWRIAAGLSDGHALTETLISAAWLAPVALIALAILCTIAWVQARAAMFTVTNRRVVVRHGVALEMAVNLPFAKIESVDLKTHGDGTGDVVLTMAGPDRLAYAHMWPFARPWHLSQVKPNLRVIDDPERVAGILGEALAAWHAEHGTETATAPAKRPARRPVTTAEPALG